MYQINSLVPVDVCCDVGENQMSTKVVSQEHEKK